MSVSSSSSSSSHDGNASKEITTSTTVMRVPPFVPQQRVFCSDEISGTSLFEAVILKSSWTGNHWNFLVHFLGWNARWDKWLEESSIFADTPEIRTRVAQDASNKRRLVDDSTSSSRKKRTVESSSRPSLVAQSCELPFLLKTILVQDREHVMRWKETTTCDSCWKPSRLVHDLPARVTIQTVLAHFCKCQKKKYTDKLEAKQAEDKAHTFVQDLSQLFDDSLAVCLLYPPERVQYEATMQSNTTLSQSSKRPVEVYGCEFLLRFLVRLPLLLQYPPEKEHASLLADLIVLLQKNRQACFKARYREPKQEELQDWERALQDGTTDIVMDE